MADTGTQIVTWISLFVVLFLMVFWYVPKHESGASAVFSGITSAIFAGVSLSTIAVLVKPDAFPFATTDNNTCVEPKKLPPFVASMGGICGVALLVWYIVYWSHKALSKK